LSLAAGEIFALLGPSGCGKSTLLRLVAGLERPTTGRITIDGRPIQAAGAPPVGMVFQEPLLLPWLTVAENIGLGLRYAANRAMRGAEAVVGALRDFGLTPLADAYPTELSGGQAQRVSLARTIVAGPRLLVLDEPFAALDPRTRAALQDWLLEIVGRRQLTALLVTHDVDEALYLGDRIGLMSPPPGGITHSWSVNGEAGEDRRRRRGGAAATALRQAILALYQTDIPPETAAPSWVI
jgi:ABC-type nitrate/sulfonate/bicarbonate transport system ATPase subunit